MNIDVLFAAVAVADLPPAVAWYGELFGRPPDIVPNGDEVMWQVTDAGWLYVVHDEERAGRSLVTLCVADLEQAMAEVAGRGVRTGAIEPVGTAGRKANVVDPEGNTVSFIEVAQSD